MTALRILRPGKSQNVAVGASSVQSAAFQAGTRWVRAVASVACYIAIGSNPTATVGSVYLAPNWPETFQINYDETVAVIEASSAGILNLTEVSG